MEADMMNMEGTENGWVDGDQEPNVETWNI